MIPIVYHPRYNVTAFGLERLDPFDSRKYARIHDALIARGLRQTRDFVRPGAVTRQELLRRHTPEYCDRLLISAIPPQSPPVYQPSHVARLRRAEGCTAN